MATCRVEAHVFDESGAAAALHGAADEAEDPADVALCPEYERAGTCSRGEDCPLIHGDQCQVGGFWGGCFPFSQLSHMTSSS